MSQRSAPLLEALARVEKHPPTGFGAPGHAAGRAATLDVLKLVGRRAFRADVLTPKGLDDRSELFETTSPSVAILASHDTTRRDHALHGRRIWNRVLALAARTRKALDAVPGVRVLGRERRDGDGAFDLDATKITFDVAASA